MSTNKVSFIIVIILLLLGVGILWWWYQNTNPSSTNGDIAPIISDFKVDLTDREFISETKNSQKVEVIALTEASEEENIIGQMELAVSKNGIQKWTLDVPENPVAADRIIARAYGENDLMAEATLPIVGSKEIYNSLWLQVPFEEVTLSIGESYDTEGLSIKLIDIPQDDRCPVEVECIQAGAVTADLEVEVEDRTQVISIKSGAGERQVGEYYITLVDVKPEAKEGVTISIGDYKLLFYITKDIAKAL